MLEMKAMMSVLPVILHVQMEETALEKEPHSCVPVHQTGLDSTAPVTVCLVMVTMIHVSLVLVFQMAQMSGVIVL